MKYRITAADRAEFKRCRRRWDLGSPAGRNLEPVAGPAPVDVDRVVKDALAVYYFPGMWDWSSEIVLPLARKALARSLDEHGAGDRETRLAVALLDSYMAMAPDLDDFSPIQIDHDPEATVPDPDEPERGLVTAGEPVEYEGRVDLLAVDADDAYWVVCHRVVPDWSETDRLVLDEEAVTACWVWEQCYVGVRIAGTIHNEISCAALPERMSPDAETPVHRGGLAQNEPSGGGRSITRHRRLYRPDRSAPDAAQRLTQHTLGPLRRTRVRRSRAEIQQAASLLGAQAREMIDTDLVPYPAPSPAHCHDCPFTAPCVAMNRGADPEPLLARDYRQHRPAPRARLGTRTWGYGRGAAPPPS